MRSAQGFRSAMVLNFALLFLTNQNTARSINKANYSAKICYTMCQWLFSPMLADIFTSTELQFSIATRMDHDGLSIEVHWKPSSGPIVDPRCTATTRQRDQTNRNAVFAVNISTYCFLTDFLRMMRLIQVGKLTKWSRALCVRVCVSADTVNGFVFAILIDKFQHRNFIRRPMH